MLRRFAVATLRDMPELGMTEDDLRTLAKDKEWADETCLVALASALGVTIHVVASFREEEEATCPYRRYAPPGGAESSCDVFLTYIKPIHYNALDLTP